MYVHQGKAVDRWRVRVGKCVSVGIVELAATHVCDYNMGTVLGMLVRSAGTDGTRRLLALTTYGRLR